MEWKKDIISFVFRKVAIIAILVFVVGMIMMGSAFVIFRTDLRDFAKESQDYYDSLEVNSEGITSSSNEETSQKLQIVEKTVLAVSNKYDKIASIGLSSVEQLANSNIILDSISISATNYINKSILLAANSGADTTTTQLPTSEKAKEVAKNISGLERYISDSSDKTREEKLEYLLNAEAITKFPYIAAIANDSSKLNGIIKFHRYTKLIDENTNTPKKYELTYVEQEEFNRLFEDYENSGNKQVFKHFTINDTQDVVIAGGVETVNTVTTDDAEVTKDVVNAQKTSTETYEKESNGKYKSVKYEATKQEIDYKSLTEAYVLPFNFLATVLIQTRDYDLAAELAKLAYDSEIIIGIYDNESISVTDDVYTYNKFLEYTEYTEITNEMFEKAGIDINDSKYDGVITYCKGELSTNSQNGDTILKHFLTPGYDGTTFNNGNTPTGQLYEDYISKLTAEQKISQISETAYEFTTTHNITITSNATATKGVILADVWTGKWTATVEGEIYKSEPQVSSADLTDEQFQDVTAQKFTNGVNDAYKKIIEPILTQHSELIKKEAIDQIMEKEEAAGTFDVPIEEIIIGEITIEELTEENIREHCSPMSETNCKECRGKMGRFGIPTRWFFGDGYYTDDFDAEVVRSVNEDEELQDVKAHIEAELIEEIRQQKLEEAEEKRRQELARAEREKQQLMEDFRENLEKNLKYSQTVVARKANVNISHTIEYNTESTQYEKVSTTTENTGKRFKKAINKAKFQETKRGMFDREGWFWDSIRLNDNTAKIENVIRYLFNIATGTSDYIDDPDFDFETMFECMFENELIAMNLGEAGTLRELLYSFEGTGEIVVENGVEYYVAYGDALAGNLPTIGPGITTWKMDLFPEEYKGWGVGDKIPVSVVDEVHEKILEGNISTAKSYFPEATSYQIIALASLAYNSGSVYDEIKELFHEYIKNEEDKFEQYVDANKVRNYINQLENGGNVLDIQKQLVQEINCSLYEEYWSKYVNTKKQSNVPGLVKRRYLEWLMFQYGYIYTTNSYYTGEEANETQRKIAEVAQNSAKYGVVAQKDMCLGWVGDVYKAAGAEYTGACCARCAGAKYGVSTDFSSIPIGAAVYGYSSYGEWGPSCGHVAIYIGDGKVADNVGYARITTLEEWLKEYPGGCWGWTSKTPVNSNYPISDKQLIKPGTH